MAQRLSAHDQEADAAIQVLSSDIDDEIPQQHTLQSNLRPASHLVTRPLSPFRQRAAFGRSPNTWSMFM